MGSPQTVRAKGACLISKSQATAYQKSRRNMRTSRGAILHAGTGVVHSFDREKQSEFSSSPLANLRLQICGTFCTLSRALFAVGPKAFSLVGGLQPKYMGQNQRHLSLGGEP